ncbi:MAG: hypothetical protein QOC78_1773 [Solirubrobacteraceae bacterium]|jgi:hypothetical protein|nr:hypothetical protein [Solirubrobacteraceae bacterium]
MMWWQDDGVGGTSHADLRRWLDRALSHGTVALRLLDIPGIRGDSGDRLLSAANDRWSMECVVRAREQEWLLETWPAALRTDPPLDAVASGWLVAPPQLRGRYASSPGMADELLEDRRREGADDAQRVLDGIPGAAERAQDGLKQAADGETVPLDELAGRIRARGPYAGPSSAPLVREDRQREEPADAPRVDEDLGRFQAGLTDPFADG